MAKGFIVNIKGEPVFEFNDGDFIELRLAGQHPQGVTVHTMGPTHIKLIDIFTLQERVMHVQEFAQYCMDHQITVTYIGDGWKKAEEPT